MEGKICPLRLIAQPANLRGAAECKGESCAWCYGGSCAVVDIARGANDIAAISDNIYSLEETLSERV